MKIYFHEGDLPKGVSFGKLIAVDSETLGINPARDRLCLVQLSAGDGLCHIVRFRKGQSDAPNLTALLEDPETTKIFHYARFDVAAFRKHLSVTTRNVWCTKIGSKLARTYTDKHGLKDVIKDLLDIDISKQHQSSDWGSDNLSEAQLAYAASDVAHLHKLKSILEKMLIREDRLALALRCFEFLETRATLDLLGWSSEDIFSL